MNLNLFATFTIIVFVVNSSKGAPDNLENLRTLGKSFGELADGLETIVELSDHDKKDIIALTGSQQLKKQWYWPKVSKLSNIFSLLRRVEAIGLLYDLFSGESVASVRHKEILGEFRKQSSNFRKISAQIMSQTNRVLEAIWESHQLHFEKDLKAMDKALYNYERNPTKTTEDPLVEAYLQGTVSSNTIGLRDSMYQRAKSITDKQMDCKPIVYLKAYASALLVRPYLAHKIGCELTARRNNENRNTIEKICTTKNLPDANDFQRKLDEVAKECGSRKNVVKYLGKFIDEKIKESDSIQETSDKLGNFMEKFSYMTFVGVVYPPLYGEENHWVTTHVHRFRKYNKMNIAVAILGKCDNYPNCRVSKNCINPVPPTKRHCWYHPDEKNNERCGQVPIHWDAKDYFEEVDATLRISRGVNTDNDLGLFVIKESNDWATFYDGNIIRSYCSKKTDRGGYRIIYRYNT